MMRHRNNLLRKIMYVILLSVSIGTSFAQTPVISLDGNPETVGISPPPGAVITGETIVLAVTIRNVHDLHSYSVKFLFDPQIVAFNGAVAKLSPLTPAFLESRQGRLAAFLSVPGDGVAEIAATQAGSDTSKCAEGDGIIGYLSFTAKTNGNPHIKIEAARLVDPHGKNIAAEIN
jgi:hypothetical protein